MSMGVRGKEEEVAKQTVKDLKEEILKQRKQKEDEGKMYKNMISSCQPSTAMVNKVFADKEKYFEKHQNLEKEFSPHPSLLKGKIIYILCVETQRKTRFGGNPPHQDTFGIIQAPSEAATYISEKDRFNVRCLAGVDFLDKEKEKRQMRDLHKIERLKQVNNVIKQNTAMKEFLHEEKDTYSLLQRTQKLFRYEMVMIDYLLSD